MTVNARIKTGGFLNAYFSFLKVLDIANEGIAVEKHSAFLPVFRFMCDLKHNVEIGQVMTRHKDKLPEGFQENLPKLIQFMVSNQFITR